MKMSNLVSACKPRRRSKYGHGAAQPGKELLRGKEQTGVGEAQTAPALDFKINDLQLCGGARGKSGQDGEWCKWAGSGQLGVEVLRPAPTGRFLLTWQQAERTDPCEFEHARVRL